MPLAPSSARPAVLGIRANLAQFAILVGVNGLVGALVGQERTLVPLIGERVFAVRSATAALLFIATFGLAKAAANLAAGALAERAGRKRVLVAGWVIGLPVPLVLMWAPSWGWVVVANVLLGVNQGLTWSTTVIMKIDLAGPRRRGLAMGINEAAGYLAVALSAAASGWLAARYGLRPEPFLLGLAVAGVGLGISVAFVRDTARHVLVEGGGESRRLRAVAPLVSHRDRVLAATCRTGLVNNANDALAWGLVPVLLVREGVGAAGVGAVAGAYPAVWALTQLVTGALSDRIGRRLPIASGMWLQAVALVGFAVAGTLTGWIASAVLLGVGTALCYPTLLAAVADRAAPAWRAAAVGVYRTWRDAGYVAGALGAGALADAVGVEGAVLAVAAITGASGVDAWRNLEPEGRGRGG